ncbi:cytochrome c peroxidase [Spirosoma fluviale]|uniref:Cytochrome c peroxidase n=1 Tax=Spirosoma fluviale TaxID=1597977 RepID=A0A286F7E7_9BACT|nr:cytochrome c peroxidase [Spirosoma fluviale]SOD79145.1 cytochrome c peroxidase [Spirosoma fluviale]
MYRLLRLFIGVVILLAFLPKQNTPNSDGVAVYQQFLIDNSRFRQQVEQLTVYVSTNAPDDSLRAAFRRSRLAYKQMEWLLDYYQPFLASHINGPPVVEVEGNEPGQVPILPSGLQVVETFLFPDYNPTRKAELTRELTVLLTYSTRLEQGIPEGKLGDADILTSIQQQLFRIIALGISGYDAPEAKTGLAEAAASLQAVQNAFRPYAAQLPPEIAVQLANRWREAIGVLERSKNFETFDRVSFIRQQLYPLCRALKQARQILNIPAGGRNHFLSSTVATLSDTGVFRPDYLINFGEFVSTPQKVALGRLLFFDPILSGNNARSCASCHQPERAFTDGRVRSRSFKGRKQVLRNAPTLINAGLQNAQFYDSRALYLEDQAHDVLSNAHEMRTSPHEVVAKLSSSATYRKMFAEAFPNGLTAPAVRNALAAYIRSLTGLNARPDRYLRGDSVALSAEEMLGFNLFLGKARCATCHFFPIFNGFVPPHYEKTESEIIGVPRSPKTRNARLDADIGKFGTYQKNLHRFAFKTPTVRNVALTAPYMHNGVYKTLEQVVDFYNRGGGRGIGIPLDGQTLPDAPLNLTSVEQKAVVAFLNALTDTTGLTQRPHELPLMDQQTKLNWRKPGGRY